MYARTTAGLVLLFVSAALAAAASGVPQSPPPRIGDGMPPSDTARGAGASATYYDRNGKPVSISGTFDYAKGPGLTGTPFRKVVLQSGSDTIYIRQERDDGEISIRIQAADGTWKDSYKVWLAPPRRSNTPTPIPTPTNPVISAPPAASPVATPPTTAAATPSRNSVLPQGASARGTSGMNVDKAADKLNAIALGAVGYCASNVQQALKAGGVSGAGHPAEARQYGPYLLSKGFISVPQEGYQPQKGDIVVIQPDPNSASQVRYGHIAMYDGSQWISDFKQRDFLDTGVKVSNLAEQPNRKRYQFYRP
jgi:hypothetical protein